MAILTGVPGLEACILVDDKPLTEHTEEGQDVQDTGKETTKYVESKAGSSFTIQWKFAHDFPFSKDDTIRCKVSIDGISSFSRLYDEKRRSKKQTHTLKGLTYQEAGIWKKSGFLFATLVMWEAATVKGEDLENMRMMGTITVTFARAVKLRRALNARNRLMLGNDAVAEKKLKGQAPSHQVKLGEARSGAPPRTWSVAYPYGKEPFATFHFKYRSKSSLQCLCLIPMDPTPVGLEDKPVEDLTAEELRELVRRQRVWVDETRAPNIKKEIQQQRNVDENNGHSDSVLVKEERPRKALKVSTLGGLEVIDLSGD